MLREDGLLRESRREHGLLRALLLLHGRLCLRRVLQSRSSKHVLLLRQHVLLLMVLVVLLLLLVPVLTTVRERKHISRDGGKNAVCGVRNLREWMG